MTRSCEQPASDVSPGHRRRALLLHFLMWGVTALLVLLTVVLVIVKATRRAPDLVPTPRKLANVATQEVVPREYRESLILPARLEADRSAVISSEIPGRLEKWYVDESAAVSAGDLLAELNSDELSNRLEQLRARLESARRRVTVSEQNLEMVRVGLTQAEEDAETLALELEGAQSGLELARKEYTRLTTLKADNIVTQADVDSAQDRLNQARITVEKVQDSQEKAKTSILAARVRVAQAEAALDLEKAGVQEIQREIEGVKVDLDKCRIRAPFAGRFEEHSVEAGEVVSPGLTLGRVYDLRYLRARVDVPDRYAPLVDPNSPLVGTYVTAAMPGARQSLAATVRIPGLPKLMGGTHSGVAMDAEIARVAQAADPRSNTFQVELRFENPGEALKEGILAEAQIDFLTYPEALVIPVKAVQVSDVGPRVFVVEQDSGQSVARVRDIEPISIREDRILVRGGLSPHEQLIVSGGKGLVDGEPVNVVIVDGELTTGDDRAAVAAAGESGEAAGFIKVPAGVAAGQQPGAAE